MNKFQKFLTLVLFKANNLPRWETAVGNSGMFREPVGESTNALISQVLTPEEVEQYRMMSARTTLGWYLSDWFDTLFVWNFADYELDGVNFASI